VLVGELLGELGGLAVGPDVGGLVVGPKVGSVVETTALLGLVV
jgi:hypothetical protein